MCKALTADERNRKFKYGHAVPRSWIPDFNATHQKPQAKPMDTPELMAHLDQALQQQRRAIRWGGHGRSTLRSLSCSSWQVQSKITHSGAAVA